MGNYYNVDQVGERYMSYVTVIIKSSYSKPLLFGARKQIININYNVKKQTNNKKQTQTFWAFHNCYVSGIVTV